ncbi:MAG TPA: DNA polymerase domain-containing protein [Elusimicrobiota bacterium]|nr:DNA polymerase domain-containing protein [Elusimicrobiota bacterium]
MRRLNGWIFDAYPEGSGVRLWVLTPEGRHASFFDDWRPSFCVDGDAGSVEAARRVLTKAGVPLETAWREKTDLYTGRSRRVLEARTPVGVHGRLVKTLRDLRVPLFNADLPPIQHYHYERGHFPLARGEFEAEGDRLTAFHLRDDPWSVDYALPPLTTMHLSLAGSEVAGALDPNHRALGSLRLLYEGNAYELEGSTEDQFESLERRLREWDPDVITSDWGDSYLLPRLIDQSAGRGRPLPFSRDPRRTHAGRGSRSFMTYGRTVYQTGSVTLFGRCHFDLKNSFYFKECGFDGLFEIARIAKIPLQRAARSTIGTSLSSMQLHRAHERNLLIPIEKQQAEDFRPATELVVADKGGLVYEAPAGWYDHVVEYDFVSMYPTLMVQHNISPETVNCACCGGDAASGDGGDAVPEIGHHLCRRRRGLVPEVLAPILEKRSRYKTLAKTDSPNRRIYKNRANAHKWVLVCCFGYLGFKNARFGKIESHECVTAWGREILLRAKETVERRGYRVLHGIVDSLWIVGHPGMDYEALRRDIEREAGCPVGLEGVYKWIRFCPSKTDPLAGVPARYFGAFTNGELKVRGLALRRRDTPGLLKEMQEGMLRDLSRAADVEECRGSLPALREKSEEYRYRLKEGRVTPPELAVTFHLSKDPAHYVHDTLSTLAAKQLAASGVPLHAGESVKYIIRAAGDRLKENRSIPLAFLHEGFDYDAQKYGEKLAEAAEEILGGLGPEAPARGKNPPAAPARKRFPKGRRKGKLPVAELFTHPYETERNVP